jgi:hypothetical protein
MCVWAYSTLDLCATGCDQLEVPSPLSPTLSHVLSFFVHRQDDDQFVQLSPFFVDLVHCLLAFSANAVDKIAQEAVAYLARLGANLAFGRVPIDDGSSVLPVALWRHRRRTSG